ncbi:hypothetical protein BDZ91DRAFT_790371 [Kalaharituber pfeilii]|nr:hypothetical protein BDZ91DRAFT_790371 [Kalaharituber pfeilii]
MSDEATSSKKRKSNQKASLDLLKGIPVENMLANAQYNREGLEEVKEKVYDRILEYIEIEGYPTEGVLDFKESNINHLIYSIISPIIRNFRTLTRRLNIQFRSENEVLSQNGETGGQEEFAVIDLISEDEEVFIFVIEVETSSVGKAMGQ